MTNSGPTGTQRPTPAQGSATREELQNIELAMGRERVKQNTKEQQKANLAKDETEKISRNLVIRLPVGAGDREDGRRRGGGRERRRERRAREDENERGGGSDESLKNTGTRQVESSKKRTRLTRSSSLSLSSVFYLFFYKLKKVLLVIQTNKLSKFSFIKQARGDESSLHQSPVPTKERLVSKLES